MKTVMYAEDLLDLLQSLPRSCAGFNGSCELFVPLKPFILQLTEMIERKKAENQEMEREK